MVGSRLKVVSSVIPGEAVDYVARVRELGPMILKYADQIEQDQRLPDGLLDKLHEAGLYRMLLPKVYGGGEVTPITLFETLSAVAEYDGSTAWCLGQANGCCIVAALLEESAAKAIWGDPRGALCWGVGRGEAKPIEGGYSVTGNWMFASGGHHVTWLGAQYVTILDEHGDPRLEPNGEPMVRTLAFPAKEAERKIAWNVIGLRGTGSDGYAIQDLFIPEKFLFHRDVMEGVRIKSPLYAFQSNVLYTTCFAGVSLGLARGILESFKTLATEKKGRFGKTLLKDNAFTQSEVAVAEARIRSARAYVKEELQSVWEDVLASGATTPDHRMRIRLATTFGIHEAKAAADIAYHAAGATAIFASNGFERRFRDLHAAMQQIQGHKIHYQTVGAYLMGNEPDLAAI
ncbi:MAG: acyl-CoA dehydrogenase family protein [Rhodospirillales bacterium]